jgi:hypothetical protein
MEIVSFVQIYANRPLIVRGSVVVKVFCFKTGGRGLETG